ncbi:MAG: glycerophosphodiester phosphodiesterase family protein [Acidocella sp.]|nr:glycerophosphodiester phosphodiesterase family protein [Acidocella sp.]
MTKAAIYGHRGARGECPENTLAGFAHAMAAGVTGFETDISLTADLIPVLHHNPDLPDGRLIRNLNFAELSGIPTLAEALAQFPHLNWLLEIKTFPPTPEKCHAPALMVEKTLEAIAASGISPDLISILAFDWSVLREVAAQAPTMPRVCLTAPDTEAEPVLWWGVTSPASTPQAVADSGATAWAAHFETLSEHKIHKARALGLKIYSWTVNDPAQFTRLSPLIDVIMTDYPTRFIPPPR